VAAPLDACLGHAGRWLLAIGVDDLSGKLSSSAFDGFRLRRSYSPFSANAYVQNTQAVRTRTTTPELTAA
jgi:hypothetical protein